jgi:4-hydroxybenzoate polyprenyltransferase
VNTTSGTALMLAAFLSDGLSTRACKICLTIAISLLAGAAMSHAVGRSVLIRHKSAEADRQAGAHG